MPKKNRLIVSYTRREWILIEHQIKLRNKKSVLNFLISEIKNLDAECENLQPAIGQFAEIDKRQYYPPNDTQEILERLSEKMKIPPATIVSRLLLSPLLKYQLIL